MDDWKGDEANVKNVNNWQNIDEEYIGFFDTGLAFFFVNLKYFKIKVFFSITIQSTRMPSLTISWFSMTSMNDRMESSESEGERQVQANS